ncbi:MAG TPA: hypothetical protein VGL54_01010 [Solirubrobacteraceae bacterium]|jgi:hypothetical protein
MEGTLVGGNENICNETGTGGTVGKEKAEAEEVEDAKEEEVGAHPINYFEPMKTIRAAYKGQHLLTTANEARKPRTKGAKVGFEQAGISDTDELLFEETAEIEG